jgi:hypothetical protein
MTSYRMNLISAGSISRDSIFKKCKARQGTTKLGHQEKRDLSPPSTWQGTALLSSSWGAPAEPFVALQARRRCDPVLRHVARTGPPHPSAAGCTALPPVAAACRGPAGGGRTGPPTAGVHTAPAAGGDDSRTGPPAAAGRTGPAGRTGQLWPGGVVPSGLWTAAGDCGAAGGRVRRVNTGLHRRRSFRLAADDERKAAAG